MLFSKRSAQACWPFALLLASSAFAQNTLQPVVVSASRTEQRVQDALPSTTVITRGQIDRAQTADLPTLLRSVAGVEIAQNGGAGTVSSAFLRGAESRHTLVLIDGVPVNNANFGTASLEHLPLADVERIEVVRGNVSSLYGSSAVGGVIQIFTRPAGTTPTAQLSAQAGSRSFAQGSVSGSVRTAGGTGLRASLEGVHDGGFNSIRQDQRPGTDPDRDPYARRSGSLHISQDLGREQSVGLTLRDARGRTHYDNQFGPANQEDMSRFRAGGATLAGNFRLGPVRLHALAGRSRDDLDAGVAAFPFFFHSRSDTAQLSADWEVRAGQHVTAGIERTQQKLVSDTVYTRSDRDVDSARLGYTLDADAHQLQLNVRHDRYSDFGSADTWLAAYGYRFTDAWRVSGSLSTGFTAPTFNDLFFPFGGNPALRPERVRSAEIGLQYAVTGHTLRATLFQNRFRDLIASDFFFNRVNIGNARTRGLEVTYDGRLLETDVHAALTQQDPKNLDTGALLPRRARTLAQVSLDRNFGAWEAGARLRYSGRRADPPRQLGAYAVLDLTAGYRWTPELRLFARLENVFDREYQTVYGYRQAGRGVFVGVRYEPKF